jgi:4-amino-4-deoxy-L-arabinose transferase-like glycosyltransferase
LDHRAVPEPDAPSHSPAHPPAGTTRRFGWWLAAIACGALALRVAYVLIARRDFEPGGDAYFYHAGANLLADGKGFISPFLYASGRSMPAAEHPPLYTMFLAVPSILGMTSTLTHLLWSCLLGAATVALVGLLGREVAGEAVGLLAAAIAAVYPNIWAPDGMLQAETIAMCATTAAVLLAYRYWRRPTWRGIAIVGVVCGLAALSRSELVLLVVFLVVPLALLVPAVATRQRLVWLGIGVLSTLVVIAPWSIYNVTRFEHPILLSAQIDPLLASANCDSTYYGRLQGYFDIRCAQRIHDREGVTLDDDQSVENMVYRRAAYDYVRHHTGRLPTVIRTRLLRSVGLYEPTFYLNMDSLVEGRDLWVSRAALYSFYVLAVLAVIGAIVVRRRRERPLFPLLAPIGVFLVTVVVTYASTRFRATAEPMIAVLAAVAIEAAVDRVVRTRAAVDAAPPEPAAAARAG